MHRSHSMLCAGKKPTASNTMHDTEAGIAFSKWSPGGNTTIFFPASVPASRRAALAKHALDSEGLCAEQVGFLDRENSCLTMAGGEFCVNATRAFAAQKALWEDEDENNRDDNWNNAEKDVPCATQKTHTLSVSGWPTPLELTTVGRCPTWDVSLTLRALSFPREDIGEGMTVLSLPGITHVLLAESIHPFPAEHAVSYHAALRERLRRTEDLCVGLVWWRKTDQGYAIRPLVHVKATDTTILEKCCGSASLALAVNLWAPRQENSFRIEQPGSSVLTVTLPHADEALVSGRVSLVAQGMFWPSCADAARG